MIKLGKVTDASDQIFYFIFDYFSFWIIELFYAQLNCHIICFLIGNVTILRQRRDMTRSMFLLTSIRSFHKKNLDRFDGHMMIRVFDRYVLVMSPSLSPLQLNNCHSIKMLRNFFKVLDIWYQIVYSYLSKKVRILSSFRKYLTLKRVSAFPLAKLIFIDMFPYQRCSTNFALLPIFVKGESSLFFLHHNPNLLKLKLCPSMKSFVLARY